MGRFFHLGQVKLIFKIYYNLSNKQKDMTVSLEKIFFAYILDNKKYFEIVKSFFFKNNEIRFVYDVIRKYIIANRDAKIPSPKQILEMVALEDKEKIITKDILKAILKPDPEFNDESWQVNFLIPKFTGWILANRLKTGTSDIIEHTRDLDNIADINDALQSAAKIKEIIDEASKTSFMNDDDDMGSDFDIAELHSQDSSVLKVRTGFGTLDHVLGGGWDVSTLNMIMAETNAGKCSFSSTMITLRNKETLDEKSIKIDTLFSDIRNTPSIEKIQNKRCKNA